MPGKTAFKSKKPALQRARELPDNAQLEEGDHWFAIATPWWEVFQACPKANDAPSVQNVMLIDKQLSSKTRNVAVLKPKLEEGKDFVFVPEASWEVIARELGFDWEIRREVIYQRSQQQLQIEPYPFVFKIFSWTADETEPVELVDNAGREVAIPGSRVHTLGQLLSEVWLASPDTFRRKFPQFLGGIDPTSSSSTSASQIRTCYHAVRACDGEMEWKPIKKMLKRHRAARTSLRLKPRAKKRQARSDEEGSSDYQQSDEGDESEAEYDEYSKGEIMNVKLGDLRFDNRSGTANGTARLHDVLVEQKAQGEVGWPSQRLELQWRMALAKDDILDALDTSRTWFEARLIAARRNKVHVHYRSWETKWDEWIPRTSSRIAPPYSRVTRWRSALRPHSLVQVGLQVPQLRHTKWRNATVIEVVPRSDTEQPQRDSDGVGLRVHVQVDDDDIWLPAHDDLLCQSNTHNMSKPLTKRERHLLSHDDTMASDSSEVAAEDEDDDEDEEEVVQVDNEEDATNLMEHEASSSPPFRSPKANAALELTSRRARFGAARNLNASFSQVQDRVVSSAGRTPARGGRSRSRSQSRASSNDTSPELVSPAPRQSTERPNRNDLRTWWTQVGNDLQALQSNLQALQTSWTQLGEGLVAAMEVDDNGQD